MYNFQTSVIRTDTEGNHAHYIVNFKLKPVDPRTQETKMVFKLVKLLNVFLP